MEKNANGLNKYAINEFRKTKCYWNSKISTLARV